MMFSLLTCLMGALFVSAAAQAGPVPAPGPFAALTTEENAQLARQTKIDGRVRIYEKATVRFASELSKLVNQEDFPEVRARLALWQGLLSGSVSDIVSSVPRGKRPKAVIKYEIQLRKVIAEMQSLRVTASVEAFDAFQEWAASAEECRKSIMAVIFPK